MLKLRKLFAVVLTLLIVLNAFTVDIYAHNAFFLSASIDSFGNGYFFEALQDNHKESSFLNDREDLHIEHNLLKSKDLIEGARNLNFEYADFAKTTEDIRTENHANIHIFTFPATYETKLKNGLSSQESGNADQTDLQNMQRIIDNAGQSATKLMQLSNNNNKFERTDMYVTQGEKLIRLIENKETVVTHINNETITLTHLKEEQGFLTVRQEIKAVNGRTFTDTYTLKIQEEKGSSTHLEEDKYIRSSYLIMQANYNYALLGYTSSANRNAVSNATLLERSLNDFFANAFNSLVLALGLKSLPELLFGVQDPFNSTQYLAGTTIRVNQYYQALPFFLVLLFISILLNSSIVVFRILKANTQKGNVTAAVQLKESLKDVLLNNMFMLIFPSLFFAGLLVNHLFLQSFAEVFSPAELQNFAIAAGSSFLVIFMQLFILVLVIYLNLLFIHRNIMLLAYFVCSPLVFALSAAGNRTILSTFLKEFLYYIFMPIIFAFSVWITKSYLTSTSLLESLAGTFFVVSIANVFKNLFFTKEDMGGRFGAAGVMMTAVAAKQALNVGTAGVGAATHFGKADSSLYNRNFAKSLGDTAMAAGAMGTMGAIDPKMGAMAGGMIARGSAMGNEALNRRELAGRNAAQNVITKRNNLEEKAKKGINEFSKGTDTTKVAYNTKDLSVADLRNLNEVEKTYNQYTQAAQDGDVDRASILKSELNQRGVIGVKRDGNNVEIEAKNKVFNNSDFSIKKDYNGITNKEILSVDNKKGNEIVPDFTKKHYQPSAPSALTAPTTAPSTSKIDSTSPPQLQQEPRKLNIEEEERRRKETEEVIKQIEKRRED